MCIRDSLGAGGKSRLQLEGVVRGAVGHQTVAGSIHKDVYKRQAEHQPVDDGGVAAATAGLDAQAAVGVVHQALGDHHILHTAAHLAANDDAAMAFVQQAVADNGVLTALFQLHAKEYLAGLHGNAPNTDGIDPECCEYIRIIGVNIHVGDDCIAMKASKVFLGMKPVSYTHLYPD